MYKKDDGQSAFYLAMFLLLVFLFGVGWLLYNRFHPLVTLVQ